MPHHKKWHKHVCGFELPATKPDYDVKLVDAVLPRQVYITKKHIRECTPGSCTDCVLARALRFAANLPVGINVVIGSNFAYVPTQAPATGRWEVWRYGIPTATRRALETWDLSGEGFSVGYYTLKPVTAGRTLEHSKQHSRAHVIRKAAGLSAKRAAVREPLNRKYRRYLNEPASVIRPAQPLTASA